jgi:LuxR family maltose regulon positive regulatory protein
LGHPLTLLAAPAGWGKSTLLAEWHASPTGADVPLAWVSLEPGDDAPARFWTYVIAGLRTAVPGVGEAALSLLGAPQGQGPPLETVLTVWLNDLAGLPRDVVLVLDDYHAVAARAVHETLAFVVDHLPARLHVVLATRADPPLPLARWRARGVLAELRADDLRFTPDEAAAFLTGAMGLPLDAAAVAALVARTEGWIAGLHLAALALRDRPDAPAFIASFSGSERFVADYLAEEVLEREPAPVQAFLLRTSVLDRGCAPLCAALLAAAPAPAQGEHAAGEQEAACQDMLERLERANLFLVPLDGVRRWYRYHHLFAEVLRARLRRVDPGGLTECFRRAAAWCDGQGLVDEALRYALAAGDQAHAARLVETHAAPALVRGDHAAGRAWLAQLPVALVAARPRLSLAAALALVVTGDMAAVEGHVRAAERALPGEGAPGGDPPPPEVLGQIALLRGYAALYGGDAHRGVALAARAAAALPEDSPVRPLALYTLGEARFAAGDHRAAGAAYGEAASDRTGDNAGLAVLALSGLAGCQHLAGALGRAAATCRVALELVEAHGIQRAPAAANPHAKLGWLHYEWNDLDAATRHLRAAQEVGRLGDYRALLVWVGQALAQVARARGDDPGARASLAEAERLVRPDGDPRRTAAVAAARVRLRLTPLAAAPAAALDEAVRWARESGLAADDAPSPGRELDHLTLARVLLAQPDRRPEGLRLLERLLVAADAGGRTDRVIAVLVLQALGLAARGDAAPAGRALTRALALAEPEGYVRTFVDEGPPMAALLRRATAAGGASSYVATLLAALPGTEDRGRRGAAPHSPPATWGAPEASTRALPEPLSDREREVLRLLAAGLPGPEIARTLIVAPSTVKSHLKSIYGKLGARGRVQALTRARALRLL